MTKGVIGCVKEPVPGDTEPLGTDKKPENTVPNGSVEKIERLACKNEDEEHNNTSKNDRR